MRSFRTLLLIAAGFLIGGLAFVEAWAGMQSGVASFPLARRASDAIVFYRVHSPLGYWLSVAWFITTGAVILGASCWYVWRFYRGADAKQEAVHEILSNVERAAPSGLKPLWFGLAVVALVALVTNAIG